MSRKEQAEQLVESFRNRDIDRVKLGGFDIDGVLRGKYISLDKFVSAVTNGFGFCDVIFGWDSADELYEDVGVTVTGWHSGYPDTNCAIDLDSLRYIPWEQNQPLFLVDFLAPDDQPLSVSPRQLAQRVVAKAESMGFVAKTSAEFEFWVFRETPDSVRDKDYRRLDALTPGMFGYSCLRTSQNRPYLNQLFSDLREFGIPLEGLHTETGPGVLEAAITYDDLLRSADNGALFKTAAKEISYQHGLMSTFMAKWKQDLPGSSGHLHQSLWTMDGQPAFYDQNDPLKMSDTFKHYVAGVLHTMPEFTALYAPTINSYRRLVPGMWAPTRACWAPENRTASLRTIHSPKPSSSRMELRVTGADINPYIAFSAGVAAGLWGIENKVELPEPASGNAYTLPEELAPPLPATLEEATERLRKSAIARELFGDAFVDHYCATRDWEVRQFRKAVTDWELSRYFEII